VFFGDSEEPMFITSARNETEGAFYTTWHKTDGWRGYFELHSTEYVELFSDAILSMHESEIMLKELHDKLMARLTEAGIKFARAFCRTSNVFSTNLEIWVENTVEAVMIATLLLHGIKREVKYDDPTYKTGILFSREALQRFRDLLGDNTLTDTDILARAERLVGEVKHGDAGSDDAGRKEAAL